MSFWAVRNQPGAIMFTVIPCGAHSAARALVIWVMPPRLAQ